VPNTGEVLCIRAWITGKHVIVLPKICAKEAMVLVTHCSHTYLLVVQYGSAQGKSTSKRAHIFLTNFK